MTLILGIDPGSRKTGFGIIKAIGSKAEYVTQRDYPFTPPVNYRPRLKVIFDSVAEIIAEYEPGRDGC